MKKFFRFLCILILVFQPLLSTATEPTLDYPAALDTDENIFVAVNNI